MFSHVGIILGGYHRACWWYQAPRLNTYSSKARSRHLESCPRLPGDPEERAVFFDFETSKEVSEISANSWIYPKKKQKQLQDGHYLPKIPGKHWAGLKKKKKHVSPRIFEHLGWLFRRKIPTVPGSLLRLPAIFLWQILPRWASKE